MNQYYTCHYLVLDGWLGRKQIEMWKMVGHDDEIVDCIRYNTPEGVYWTDEHVDRFPYIEDLEDSRQDYITRPLPAPLPI